MSDLISRQAAIEYFMINTNWHDEEGYSIDDCDEKRKLLEDYFNGVPSAEPEQKRGRWERHNTYHGDDTSGYIDPDWRCSVCGRQANVNEWFIYDLTDFCPNCGAKMEADND